MKSNFDGHRIYNGCPDSTMQQAMDTEAYEIRTLTAKCNRIAGGEVTVTYFPAPPAGFLPFCDYLEIDPVTRPFLSELAALRHAFDFLTTSIERGE